MRFILGVLFGVALSLLAFYAWALYTAAKLV